MKFVVDAQLPRRVVDWFRTVGADAVHTLDLPDVNRTTDAQLIAFADQEQRVVVSKDEDFVNSHLLLGKPAKLLLISTGNISNRDLESIVVPVLPTILSEFQTHAFLELGRAGLVVRG